MGKHGGRMQMMPAARQGFWQYPPGLACHILTPFLINLRSVYLASGGKSPYVMDIAVFVATVIYFRSILGS